MKSENSEEKNGLGNHKAGTAKETWGGPSFYSGIRLTMTENNCTSLHIHMTTSPTKFCAVVATTDFKPLLIPNHPKVAWEDPNRSTGVLCHQTPNNPNTRYIEQQAIRSKRHSSKHTCCWFEHNINQEKLYTWPRAAWLSPTEIDHHGGAWQHYLHETKYPLKPRITLKVSLFFRFYPDS